MQAKLARDGDLNAALALAPDSSQGLIARFVQGDIDALLPPGSAALQPLQPRQGLTNRLLRVELLRLAGRDTAAQALLEASALNIAEKLALLANPSTSSNERSMTHAHLANWAALSGKPAQAREHVAQALAIPPSDINSRREFYLRLSSAERTLGNAEAAWLLIEPYAGVSTDLSHGHLRAFKPFYDKIYGKSPSYQAYMAKIAGEKK